MPALRTPTAPKAPRKLRNDKRKGADTNDIRIQKTSDLRNGGRHVKLRSAAVRRLCKEGSAAADDVILSEGETVSAEYIRDGAAAPAKAESGYALLFGDNPVPDIAERCMPSVVGVINIVSTFNFATRKTSDEKYGFGSGVVIDGMGHIVTNAHVVQGADKLKILLSDDSEIDAELVGVDAATDLAVLHVRELDIPPIPLGDSSKLRVGELAIAIGNPGGYYGTVSVGIISALERDITSFARPMSIIQTDAAMSPGISCGALLNSRGELVGIPALGVIIYEGLNFAIPSNTVKEIVSELIEHGKVRRPGIGIFFNEQDGPDEPLKSFPPAGLLVVEVSDKGPASRADMRAGDIIYSVDGKRTKTSRDLTNAIGEKNVGEKVAFKVYRPTHEDRPAEKNFIDIDIVLEYMD